MKTQLLERLSKAAPDFVTRYKNYYGDYTYTVKTKSREIEGDDDDYQKPEFQDRFFGAICEKIEAEGWYWSFPNREPDYKYHCVVQAGLPLLKNNWSIGVSNDHPWEAAAIALCEALEGKQQEVTG